MNLKHYSLCRGDDGSISCSKGLWSHVRQHDSDSQHNSKLDRKLQNIPSCLPRLQTLPKMTQVFLPEPPLPHWAAVG